VDGISRREALRALTALAGGAAGVSVLGACESGSQEGSSSPTTTPATGTPARPVGEAKLTGRLVYPQDADYEAARLGWDRLFSSYPLVVVFCQNTDDVVNALRWCRENDVAFRARSGRHSLEGWSSLDGGVVIDVSGFKQIDVDAAAGTAVVGTGVNQGELVNALAATGHAVPVGDEATVGLAGVTLGGGIGPLARSMGATCDNLVEVETVLPLGDRDAHLVRATTRDNADLLWASRGGGGGNFGIATSFTFKIHPLPNITSFEVDWDRSQLGPAFSAWQEWAPTTDDRIGSIFVVLRPGNPVTASGVFLGPEDEARNLIAPLVAAGQPTVTLKTSSYVDWFNGQNSGPRQYLNWRFTSSWATRPFSPEAIKVIDDFMTRAPTDPCNYWCLSWGGAAGRPPEGGTAFSHRSPLFYAEPGAAWNAPEETSACVAWVAQFREAMRPHVNGAYVNVPDRAIEDFGNAYYGANFERLREVKAKYDPLNVFRFEQSVPPA
jgi:hypothetical protein